MRGSVEDVEDVPTCSIFCLSAAPLRGSTQARLSSSPSPSCLLARTSPAPVSRL